MLFASLLVVLGTACTDESTSLRGTTPASTPSNAPDDSTPGPSSVVIEPTTTPARGATTATSTQDTTLSTTLSTTSDTSPVSSTTIAPTTTTPPPPVYRFPFQGRNVSYGRTHHDYPAADVFGCGAEVVAPTGGTILEVSTTDRWDPAVNHPGTRGGLYVSLGGADGVRYYFAHLASVAVAVGDAVPAGGPLGVMGQTGNARNSACHTHFGISWECPGGEWKVRRGKVWPADLLDAWKAGEQRSPSEAVAMAALAEPEACADALAHLDG